MRSTSEIWRSNNDAMASFMRNKKISSNPLLKHTKINDFIVSLELRVNKYEVHLGTKRNQLKKKTKKKTS